MPKKPIKPLLATKHDFVDSLDAMINARIILLSAIDAAIQLGGMKEGPAKMLAEKAESFKKVIFTDD